MAHQGNGQPFDPGTRKILEELRDLRLDARADRRQAETDRRQAEADRRRSDERFEQLMRESRESFQHLIRESREERRALHEESARQAAVTQKMFEATQKTFKDVRTVGFAIVKTLNRHTRLLESMDRKLGVRGNGGTGNGRTV